MAAPATTSVPVVYPLRGLERKDADERPATYDQLPTNPDPDRDERDVGLLGELHFGFPHLTDEAHR